MRIKLTKRSLESIKVDGSRTYVYDTEIRGFGAVVLPSGAKSFFVQYRTAGGRRGAAKRLKIGDFDRLTVDEARALARQQLASVAHGQDPAARRSADKRAPTVRELGSDFLDAVRARRKPTTAREYVRLWARHVEPALGSMKVAAVTAGQVEALHRSMRSTPYLANRVLALISVFFGFAERAELRPRRTNPAELVEPYREHGRERFLTPAEVRTLGEALTLAETIGVPPAPNRRRAPAAGATARHRPKSAGNPKPANPFAIAAIRLLALSGMREREVLTLQWTDVDLERGLVVLPDSKTGKSIRHLGHPAVLLLSDLPRIEGSPFVFPGRTPMRPLVEINRVWYAVRHAAGLHDVRLHDLRHSFASAAASSGGSLLMIRQLLGHKDSATTQRYAHLSADPIRAAADETSALIARNLLAATPKKLA